MTEEAIRAAIKAAEEAEYKDGQLIIRTAEGIKTYTPTKQWKAVLDTMNK